MPDHEAMRFEDAGVVPNSRLPLLLYRNALGADPEADLADGFEALFARHGWGGSWRNGIYCFHHFHSTAHEVLGIARGKVRVLLGGPGGSTVELRAGDAVVIPAGVGHCNEGARADLLVIGAYPAGQRADLQRGADAGARDRIGKVPLPARDPVTGGPIWATG
jgi:uncharacterized protein YjlB